MAELHTIEPRLGQLDWVNAALRMLAKHGIDAVRVERLAGELNVTKGSFYWHFPNRNGLLLAVLEAWEARATSDIIRLVEAAGGDAKARFRTLGTEVFSSDGSLDRQIRAWSAHDPVARQAQERIDARRLSYLGQLFGEMGFASDAAQVRALFSYQALIGQFATEAGLRLTKAQLELVFQMLVRD